MSLTIAYTALVIGVLTWLFLVRRLSAKPWATPSGVAIGAADEQRTPPTKIGLWVFLAVVSSLFGLFISAYYMRMGMGHGADAALNDWGAVSDSPLLWINTMILVAGSVAMQSARGAANNGNALRSSRALLIGGLLTVAFLVAQFVVWRELRVSPAFNPTNPAVAFFYLLTGVHGLHLVGGLYVWARTYTRMKWRRAEIIDVRLSIELCSVYWHYLLIVWVVLFGLLLAT
jgi:cytochrome c oxidase subunit 3